MVDLGDFLLLLALGYCNLDLFCFEVFSFLWIHHGMQ